MAYFWSASSGLFYADELRGAYEASGSWPADALLVGDLAFTEYSKPPPVGKVRGSINGQPAWLDDVSSGTVQAQDVLMTLLVQKENAGVYFQPSNAPSLMLFPTDTSAIAKYGGIWSAIQAGLWTGGILIAANGTPVLISPTDAGALIKKALAYISLCGAQYALLHHRLTIDPAADITQGWPPQT